MSNYLIESIDTFKNSNAVNIAVFAPFTSTDSPFYADLKETLAKVGTVEIINEVYLNSFEAMDRGLVDILVIPEMELVMKKAFYAIKRFINQGGAVIAASDDYFMTGKILDDEFAQFDVEAVAGDAFYRATSGYLGIKPYVSDITPVQAAADPAWIPLAGSAMGAFPRAGVQMNVGSDKVSPQPPVGHVFIERYEVARNYDAVIGYDGYGNKVNSQVTFAQNWENGARFVLYNANHKNALIRKGNPLYEAVLKEAVRFCQNKVFAVSCAPNFACYRLGEEVSVAYELYNAAKDMQSVELVLEILDDNGVVVFEKQTQCWVAAESTMSEQVCWKNGKFESDSYSILFRIQKNGRLLSQADNGFVVWNEAIVNQGPAIETAGKYFALNGKSSLLTGTNYYESNIGEVMWVKPNIKKLEADFRQMSADGINYIRIHYHHAKWFKDYLKACTGQVFEYYKEIEDSPLPTERILRIFDAHIYLSQKYGIVYGGDLFTLLPEEMGDPKGWFGVQDYMWFEEKIELQKSFLKLLIPRYRSVPGIAWDIYNEPCCVNCEPYLPAFEEAFYRWSREIKNYMRELGDTHLITVGAEKPERFGDVIDFYAEHTNFKYIKDRKTNTPLPEIVQECWIDCPATPEGDQKQLGDMKLALTDIVGRGFSGFVPWQWTNQQRLWCDWRTYVGEIWDDRLGTCVRNDGTLKPAGRFYRDFIWLLDGLEFETCADGVVKTKQGTLRVDGLTGRERSVQLVQGGEVVRAVAEEKVCGKTLSLFSNNGADLFYLSMPDADYIKANQAGVLEILLKQPLASMEVCTKPDGKGIGTIAVSGETRVELVVEDSHLNYWFRLTY